MKREEADRAAVREFLVRCPRQSYTITRAMCHARQRAGLCRSIFRCARNNTLAGLSPRCEGL